MRFALFVITILCMFGLVARGQRESSKPHVAWTPFYNAETFLGLSDADRMMYATGLMDGFMGSALFGSNDEAVAALVSCAKGMTNSQISGIFTKYVKDHPETWHYPMNVEAFNAFHAVCPGKLKIVN